jgi:hypothetical protein
MAVPPQEAGQVDLSAPAIAVGTQATSIRLRREACGYVLKVRLSLSTKMLF